MISNTMGWPKISFGFFPYDGSGSAQLALTSPETILLGCILTAVISVRIKKNLAKLVNFGAAILILMEENKQHFGTLCFLISRKVKTQLKCKTRFVQCTEKVL